MLKYEDVGPYAAQTLCRSRIDVRRRKCFATRSHAAALTAVLME